MALEDLLLQLKEENPHFALLTFWQLQALLADLSTDPNCYGFQVARRVLNRLQSSLFNFSIMDDGSKVVKIHENIAPAVVLSSMMMACMGLPQMSEMAKPLVESQGRRQRAFVFKLAKNTVGKFAKNMLKAGSSSNYKKGKKSFSKSSVDLVDPVVTKEDRVFRKPKNSQEEEYSLNFDIVDTVGNRMFKEGLSAPINMRRKRANAQNHHRDSLASSFATSTTTDIEYLESKAREEGYMSLLDDDVLMDYKGEDGASSKPGGKPQKGMRELQSKDHYMSSMPNLRKVSLMNTVSALPEPKNVQQEIIRSRSQPPVENAFASLRINSHKEYTDQELSRMPTTKKIKMLKINYFRSETQFAIALESISQRLAQVPSEARLTALRAELSLMNRDMPAEVDIPTLLPPNKKGKLHRLVTITASEAQVLNSAEKVPYLLFIEYLKDDFDFNPTVERNQEILRKNNVKPLFDLNYLSRRNTYSAAYYDDDDNNINSNTNETAGRPQLRRTASSYAANADRIGRFESPTVQHRHVPPSDGHKEDNHDAHSVYSVQESVVIAPSNPSNKEVDLGDLSMIRVKNQTDAEVFRNRVVLESASKIPQIQSNSQSRAPDLTFAASFDDVLDPKRSSSREFQRRTDELADQMKISALMLKQLDNSPQELSDSAREIRSQIIASMKEVQDKFGYRDLESIHGSAGERKLANDLLTGGIDTSYLGEDWNAKKERIRKMSEYGHLENWDLCSVIAKSGDDLRQEAFACQLIQAMSQIWVKEKVDVWTKKMKILITSATTGLVETITNAVSVHSIKKSLTKKMIEDGDIDEKSGVIASIKDHFLRAFGDPTGFKYRRAQSNFARSLAAYSLICYILRVKDRHNGNIMIDNEGHVVHIDFGFMLSNSPGSVGFEAAPFKLTYEYVDLMGGLEGEAYQKFVLLMQHGFKALRKHYSQIVSMCEIMQKDNMQPCFEAGEQTSVQLRQRFHLDLPDEDVDDFVKTVLIGKSLGSTYTRLYDQFQLLTQGIYS